MVACDAISAVTSPGRPSSVVFSMHLLSLVIQAETGRRGSIDHGFQCGGSFMKFDLTHEEMNSFDDASGTFLLNYFKIYDSK